MDPLEMERLRIEYQASGLDERTMDADPIGQFGRWFDEAVASGMPEPNAMVVATADAGGRPSARTVLMKDFGAAGFVFFTNHQSRKGRELIVNPAVCLLFSWVPLHRQVRIEGTASRLPATDADAYFATRPRGARIGAWASQQSQRIASRRVLEEAAQAAEARFPGDDIPRPPYWGGYSVAPTAIEFWQGRPDRLHDRIEYRLGDAPSSWAMVRLSP